MAEEEEDKTLEEMAQEPKEFRGDQGHYKAHSLKDQIALDEHLSKNRNSSKGLNGLVTQQLRPPRAP